nr:NIa-Pro (Nuclear inclusion protein, protease) [Maize dwarf mosaic virus]
AKSMLTGLVDYTPIANQIGIIENHSDDVRLCMYAIGYGSYLITPAHLFKASNGELTFRSSRGVYKMRNSVEVKLHHVKGRDLVIIQLPKDFPPFPQKLKFQAPNRENKVCLVGVNFQQNHSSCVVSESSTIAPKGNNTFWSHWISTTGGQCGLPLVDMKTRSIVGVHSLASVNANVNFFVAMPEDFNTYLSELVSKNEWEKGWQYNPNLISWSGLNLVSSAPKGAFKTAKLVEDLSFDVTEQ